MNITETAKSREMNIPLTRNSAAEAVFLESLSFSFCMRSFCKLGK